MTTFVCRKCGKKVKQQKNKQTKCKCGHTKYIPYFEIEGEKK